MANQNYADDISTMNISIESEPHLESSQDLDLLEQEIAEAAVDDERKHLRSSSPTPSQQSHTSDTSGVVLMPESEDFIEPDKSELDSEKEQEETLMMDKQRDELEMRPERSQSPVDETSWEIVDVVEDDVRPPSDSKIKTNKRTSKQSYSVVRKFLGTRDLWQKLKEIGMVCDACTDPNVTNDSPANVLDYNDMDVSCSESMVICNIPKDTNESQEDNDPQHSEEQTEDEKTLRSWKGKIAGALVEIEPERLGALLVASVKVTHSDLLSALASLQQLASTVGLVSYADVDVQSLLARAA